MGDDPARIPALARLQDSVGALDAKLDAVLAELRSRPVQAVDRPMSIARTSFSVEEVAGMLGRSAYTVREWCRNGQINASKRSERRGAGMLWSITAEEVARHKNEGLLPISPDRNNRN